MKPNGTVQEQVEQIERAIDLLRDARDLLKAGGASRTVDRVRLAITSAGGALRHAQGRLYRSEGRG